MDTFLGIGNVIAAFTLAGITYWYARSTSRMLAQMQTQAEAATRQAEAMQTTLEFMRRAALPEWDINSTFTPKKVIISIKNNGESLGRNIQAELMPHCSKKAALHSAIPHVVHPGSTFQLHLTSEDPPYEGHLVIRSTGRLGDTQVTRWHIRLHRRDYGHRELELKVLGCTTDFGNTIGLSTVRSDHADSQGV